ncbi:MAG: hypothetical protein HYW48_09795 [Deltaproteobacteria bacterium]|nr:hypothetical protein [Deltaproteobacteria bacterium]
MKKIASSSPFLQTKLRKLRRMKRRYFGLSVFFNVLRSLLIALAIGLALIGISPETPIWTITVTLIALGISLYLSDWSRHPIDETSFLFSLDVANPGVSTSIYNRKGWGAPEFEKDWNTPVVNAMKEIRELERGRIRKKTRSLILPGILSGGLLVWVQPTSFIIFSDVVRAIAQKGAHITIIQGAASGQVQGQIPLSVKEMATIDVLGSNLLDVSFYAPAVDPPPSVVLKKPDDDNSIFQQFQMSSLSPPHKPVLHYHIQFTASDDVLVTIPAITQKPLAKISVQKLPVPELTLETREPLLTPWPDDKPLDLKINVVAKHPLQQLNLLISMNGHKMRESIHSIASTEMLTLETSYSLLLSKYMDTDFANIEIVAQALDRALPQPLVGYSNPIQLEVISSYGRYRRTLEMLREVKSSLDQSFAENSPTIHKENDKLASKIENEAEATPFFDALDRIQIGSIRRMVLKQIQGPDPHQFAQLRELVTEFLEEHEMLDDRDRDRDFFVAARSLSRILESEEFSKDQVKKVGARILTFLDQRSQRWELRTKNLAEPHKLKLWPQVRRDKPFHADIREITRQAETIGKDSSLSSLQRLSSTVAVYRQWIEELEALEDGEREAREQERQKNLLSAQEELQELQKRQLQVSSQLDHSTTRSQDELAKQWPVARTHQNTNIKDAKRLESQLLAVSPKSANRLGAALEAMKQTADSGNEGSFIKAESFSDLAGRLLRQANKAATQQERSRRGSRNRVTGDNYYGQAIIGGDIVIEHEYQVAPRYRQEVLDEILESGYEGEDRSVLNNFLRRILR